MTTTANLGITKLSATQTGKEAAINAAAVLIDACTTDADAVVVDNSNAASISSSNYLQNIVFNINPGSPLPTGTITITVPANQRGTFAVRNNTAQIVAVTIAAQSGAVPSIPAGGNAHLITDGTNISQPTTDSSAGGIVGTNGWETTGYYDFTAGVANLDIPIPADAESFKILGWMHFATSAQALRLTFSTNGGVTFDTTAGHYAWAGSAEGQSANVASGSASDTAISAAVNIGGGSNTQSGGYEINIFASQEALENTWVGCEAHMENPAAFSEAIETGGVYNQAGVVTHVRLTSSSGNIKGKLLAQKLTHQI